MPIAKNVDRTADWNDFKDRVRRAYPIDRACEDIGVKFREPASSNRRTACCPFHDDRTPSFGVVRDKGFFKCFGAGCDAGGDVFTLLRMHHGFGFVDAVHHAAERAGVSPLGGRRPRRTKTAPIRRTTGQGPEIERDPRSLLPCDLRPAPAGAPLPAPGRKVHAWREGDGGERGEVMSCTPVMVHPYRNLDGEVLAVVLRRMIRDRKSFLPMRRDVLPPGAPEDLADERDTRVGWVFGGFDSRRRKPIYGIERAWSWIDVPDRRLLLVEGEKCVERLREALGDRHPEWLVISPMGGAQSAHRADWAELFGLFAAAGAVPPLTIWPDADAPVRMRSGEIRDPRARFAADVTAAFAAAAAEAGFAIGDLSVRRVLPPDGVESGWDVADALEEGWSVERILETIETCTVAVEPDPRFFERTEEPAPAPFEPDASEVEMAFMGHPDGALAPGDAPTDAAPAAGEAPAAAAAPAADVAGAPAAGDGARPAEGIPTPPPRDLEALMGSNDHFRALGFRGNEFLVYNFARKSVISLASSAFSATTLLSMAPLEFWQAEFGSQDRNGRETVNWQKAFSSIMSACERRGLVDEERIFGVGVHRDGNGGRIVANMGARFWVEGIGLVEMDEFESDSVFVASSSLPVPDFGNAFEAGCSEIETLLEIIRSINWAAPKRRLSVLAFFGWLGIAPLSGLLSTWRPHVYLDGPKGAGKSWIFENIVGKILDHWSIRPLSASTSEAGLRRAMHAAALPVVFDEADADDKSQKAVMAQIMSVTRSAASPGAGRVIKARTSGGGVEMYRSHNIFMMGSIVSQVDRPADQSRFVEISLGEARKGINFEDRIERPVAELIDASFSARFIARVIERSPDFDAVCRCMVKAVSDLGMERRVADLFGTLAAGAWILLEDGTPASSDDAMQWIETRFDAEMEIRAHGRDIDADQDHGRVLLHLLGAQILCDTQLHGSRRLTVAELIDMLSGPERPEEGPGPREAFRQLGLLGMRPCLMAGHHLVGAGDPFDGIVIHKTSPAIRKLLKDTPYENSYAKVLAHHPRVEESSKNVIFAASRGRVIAVPLSLLRPPE